MQEKTVVAVRALLPFQEEGAVLGGAVAGADRSLFDGEVVQGLEDKGMGLRGWPARLRGCWKR